MYPAEWTREIYYLSNFSARTLCMDTLIHTYISNQDEQ